MEELKDVVAQHSIKIPESEAETYLSLLRSTEKMFQTVDDSSDYIHPALRISPNAVERKYWKPTREENPLNAWSHRCNIKSQKPNCSALEGRSICLKDNISVGGLPTTIGTFPQLVSKTGEFPISPIDATVVTRILEAGGTILGTSTCENYSACGLSYTSASGPVQNPWLHGYATGGSSSGSGALVAGTTVANATGRDFGETVDLAIGVDQGGSIRLPASYSGVYGMKPTHGLIPFTGIAPLTPMLDHVGPMATNIEDIALLLKVLAGYDGLDPRMSPESPLPASVKDYPLALSSFRKRSLNSNEKIGLGMKVGLLKESFCVPHLSKQVKDCVYDNAKEYFTLAGAEVVEISVPLHSMGEAIWTAATRASMAEWGFKVQTSGFLSHALPHFQPRWPMDQDMYDLLTEKSPAAVDVILVGALLKEKYGPAVEAKALRKVYELRAAYDAVFDEVDVLVTPTTPTVAMPHPKLKSVDNESSTIMEKVTLSAGCSSNTSPFNVTGHPAMNVPCGFGKPDVGSEGILPIGMQLIARRWDEQMILNAAAVFEEGRELSQAKENN